MSSTLAIAQRELIEKRFVFVAAVAFLALALVIPFMPGVHAGERAGALVIVSLVLATAFSLGLSAILGSTIIGREMSDGRLSFYFSKPVPATSIWWGKLLAALALIVVCFAIVAVPAFLVGSMREVHRWASTPQDMLTTALLVVVSAFGLFLLSHVIGTFVRSRSVWFLFDFVAVSVCGAAVWILGRLLFAGFAIQLMYALGVTFAALAALAITAAGAWQVSRGRTDRKRSHMELSRFLWSAIGCVLLLLSAYVVWVISVPLSGVLNPEFVQARNGSWSMIEGRTKNLDYRAAFLYNLTDGRSVRISEATPWMFRFSADGSTAAWMTKAGLNVVHLNAAKVEPVLTRVTGDALYGISEDGSRATVRGGDVVTIYDLRSQASLGSRRAVEYQFSRQPDEPMVKNEGTGSILRIKGRDGSLREIALPEPGDRWPRVTGSPNGIVSILLQKHTVVADINRGVVVSQDERMLCQGGSVGPNQLCHSAHGLVVWNPATGEKRPIS